MAASAIFILDQKGKILISRNYRGDVPMSVASRFIAKLLEDDEMNVRPITEEEGVSYIFVKFHNLFRKYLHLGHGGVAILNLSRTSTF